MVNKMEQPNYYAIIPANVRYDLNLKDKAKLLYGEIVALSNQNGECWANNNYFAKLYKVSNETISRLISSLVQQGYLKNKIIYKEKTKVIDKRILIPIDKNINTYCQNNQEGIDENIKDNNTSNNKKEINNNKLLFTKKSFKKPTLEEIKEYCQERKNTIDAEKFMDYYDSNGWKVGKNSMKDWKACVRTWEKNAKEKEELISNRHKTNYQISEDALAQARREYEND